MYRNLPLPSSINHHPGDASSSASSSPQSRPMMGESADGLFVGWSPLPHPPRVAPRGVPRLSHKKSKTGCQRCRQRRVKCNEVHPVCGGCQRHQVTCIYDHPPKRASTEDPDSSTSTPTPTPIPTSTAAAASPSKSARGTSVIDARETHLLELRLMHHFTLATSLTFPLSADPRTRDINTTIFPKLAFANESLLSAIFFITALHLVKTDPSFIEAAEASQHYLDLTLRGHRKDVASLSAANADIVCLTSSLIRMGAFAMLPDRPLNPYTPPIQWLHMNRGSGDVFRAAWDWIGDSETSVARRSVQGAPQPDLTDTDALFAEGNRGSLLHLLARHPHHVATELWTPEIQEAYESTLSYIGGVQRVVVAGDEAPAYVLRRLIAFPSLLEKMRFFELVEQGQPRSLVFLAHYFALLARFRDVWWIGDSGAREVRAIAAHLGQEWAEMMSWPVSAVEETYS